MGYPRIIDQHVHLTGGGGEAGFASRTPAVKLRDLIQAGITTVVGVLGTDAISRSPKDLYAKMQSLNLEGLRVYAYGSLRRSQPNHYAIHPR